MKVSTPPLSLSPVAPASAPIGPPPQSPPGNPTLDRFIYDKHLSYLRLARWSAVAYYCTRVVAGLGSALLPFVVTSHQQIATVLAVSVAVTVALDSIFKPRDKWQLYSKATDLLASAEMKRTGEYEKYKDQLDILMATEAAKLERLVDLKDLLKEAEIAASHSAAAK